MHRISPLGLLAVSAAVAAVGLFYLSMATGMGILVAATPPAISSARLSLAEAPSLLLGDGRITIQPRNDSAAKPMFEVSINYRVVALVPDQHC